MPQDATRSIATSLSDLLTHDGGEGLTSIMAMAREHLGMDVVVLSEFRDGRQIYRAVQGDAASFGLHVDDGVDLTQTYCNLVVEGAAPALIPDTQAEPSVRDLDATQRSRIGSYIGVPLRFSDGRLYGTFCCLSHEPDHRLARRDVAFLELLGLVLADRLETKDAEHRRRIEVEAALSSDAIRTALQPIVSLHDASVAGAEALSRFPHLGLPPDVVIAQAHDVGLGVELEMLAVRTALDQLDNVPGGGYLSINVGPAALLSTGFNDTLRESGNLDRICLEITEHISIDDYAPINDALTPLRLEGMRLAVDDVGSGYASLHHVLQTQPDILKIDRSLIDGVCLDAGRRSIVTSIVLLALDLDATVVGEGVERLDDAHALIDLGVDMMQGYLFAHPSSDRQIWDGWQARSHHLQTAHFGGATTTGRRRSPRMSRTATTT